jgi:hypothetical protein
MDRDIDRVIAPVRSRLASVSVVQWHKKHPGDDDGIWWFRLPGIARDIHDHRVTMLRKFASAVGVEAVDLFADSGRGQR